MMSKCKFQRGLLLLDLAFLAWGFAGEARAGEKKEPKAEYMVPACKPALANLALAQEFKSQEKFGQAIGEFKKALKIAPKCDVAWNDLGVTSSWDGKTDEAITAYETAIKLNPNVAVIWINYGDVLSEKGGKTGEKKWYQKALDAYQKSLSLNPQEDMGNHAKEEIQEIKKKSLK